MKEMYLDIMEKALSAYTDERIRDYIAEVRRDGLTEHGFPRLGVNIGILIAYGRKTGLLDTFIEIMDICCKEMPEKKAANDFSIREVCCCLMLIEEKKIISEELLAKWKKQLSGFDPWNKYNVVAVAPDIPVANWAMFAAVSDFVRGKYCGIDTSEFVDWQVSSQLLNLDTLDMYKDDPPTNPIVYDMVPRLLMAFLLRFGYNGKHRARIEQVLDNTADLTLEMQSVTGEIGYGGRSNQFVNNDTLLCAYCELEAVRFKEKGDLKKAGEFKAAASFAAENVMKYLNLDPISHIKNRYDISTKIGCEKYGYFNKYMITVASNLYMGALFCDESIKETELSNKKTGYVFSTSEDFHKTYLSAGGYFIELDTNADFHYDANGLGRVHKKNCSSTVCLSVPFSPHPNYVLEGENKTGMSICCYAENSGGRLLGAESYAQYCLIESKSASSGVNAVFDVKLSDEITVTHEYNVSAEGVDIRLSGQDNIGFMLPLFDFDGANSTEISIGENSVSVKYENSVCCYSFDGELSNEFEYYYNRNGRYKVYSVNSRNLHIGIENCVE